MSHPLEGRCGSCYFRDQYGTCTHRKFGQGGFIKGPDSFDMLIYSYDEGGAFYVGPQFGCVHYAKKLEPKGEAS